MSKQLGKKIKRIREAKFTEKRDPYKKYQKANWLWTDIFNEIESLKNNNVKKFIKIVSEKYGIKYKTLLNKYNKYENNNITKVDSENRGGAKKIFNAQEEYEIFLFLKDNFMDKNKMLCDEIIKLHAIDKCKKLYPTKIFKASNGWCEDFKKTWNLSTVKCSISKISTTIHTKDEIDIFIQKCKDSLDIVGSNFFST